MAGDLVKLLRSHGIRKAADSPSHKNTTLAPGASGFGLELPFIDFQAALGYLSSRSFRFLERRKLWPSVILKRLKRKSFRKLFFVPMADQGTLGIFTLSGSKRKGCEIAPICSCAIAVSVSQVHNIPVYRHPFLWNAMARSVCQGQKDGIVLPKHTSFPGFEDAEQVRVIEVLREFC
jgi:hypothetical protein